VSARKCPIAVIGAGRMGRGIAHAFAYGGHPVTIVDFKPRGSEEFERLAAEAQAEIESNLTALAREDVFPPSLIADILALIQVVPLADAAGALAEAELVWEGVPEREDAKADALRRVSAVIGPECIVASTTSTLSVTELQRHVTRPDRFLNAHFLNPAFLIPLVEVSPGPATDEAVTRRLIAMLEAIGKVPVRCTASPGYIVPRLQGLLISEAARMVHEGVASAEDIDKAIRVGFGPRYSVMGPIEFIDFGGLDIAYYACHYLAKALDSPRHAPPEGLDQLMHEGKRGLREGHGYYNWSGVDLDAYRSQRFGQFVKLFVPLGLMPKPGL
jgi:3-hydroxybutyryl-CoA dehydrogenase